jgi:putative ABC transport system ATP-binding protein
LDFGWSFERKIMTESHAIEATGITRTFFKKGKEPVTIFENITCQLGRGEFFALMGDSGCGKSTLLKIISGLETPNSGDLTISGQEIFRNGKPLMSDQQFSHFRRERVGYIFQSHQLIEELSALENVMLHLQLQGKSKKVARSRAEEMLNRVNLLNSLGAAKPSELSVGQQQRVGIARALIHRPEVVFADEPTASLDAENSREVIEMLLGIQEEYDTTVIMITHKPEDVHKLDGTLLFSRTLKTEPWKLILSKPSSPINAV